MRQHDWLFGLLGELECYSRQNNILGLADMIAGAIELGLCETSAEEESPKVVFLEDYRVHKEIPSVDEILRAFKVEIDKLVE